MDVLSANQPGTKYLIREAPAAKKSTGVRNLSLLTLYVNRLRCTYVWHQFN